MTVSKAQQKAVTKYVKTKYDRFGLTMPKGRLDIIKDRAESQGESVNGYINKAIDESMARGADVEAAQHRLAELRDMNTAAALVEEIQTATRLVSDTTWCNVAYNPQLYKKDAEKKEVAAALRDRADAIHGLFYGLADRIEKGE